MIVRLMADKDLAYYTACAPASARIVYFSILTECSPTAQHKQFFFIDGLGFGLSVEEGNVLKRVGGCDLLGCRRPN
jgi:hypothetical protein